MTLLQVVDFDILKWVVSTLLPIVLGALGIVAAMRVTIAELKRDISHLRKEVDGLWTELKSKAEKDAVHEIREDIKELKSMVLDFALDVKKNRSNT